MTRINNREQLLEVGHFFKADSQLSERQVS